MQLSLGKMWRQFHLSSKERSCNDVITLVTTRIEQFYFPHSRGRLANSFSNLV